MTTLRLPLSWARPAQRAEVSRTRSSSAVLVLLDGSRDAERVLPRAMIYARQHDVPVKLVHTYHRATLTDAAADTRASQYVQAQTHKLQAQGIAAVGYTKEGEISTDQLGTLAAELDAGTIILRTPKQSQLSRLLLGNYVQRTQDNLEQAVIFV